MIVFVLAPPASRPVFTSCAPLHPSPATVILCTPASSSLSTVLDPLSPLQEDPHRAMMIAALMLIWTT